MDFPDLSPMPRHIVVSARPSGARGEHGPRVHLPNSPRHHAAMSVAGMRPRTG